MQIKHLKWLCILIAAGLIAGSVIWTQLRLAIDGQASRAADSVSFMKDQQPERLLDQMLHASGTTFDEAQVSGWTKLETKTQREVVKERIRQLAAAEPIIRNSQISPINQIVNTCLNSLSESPPAATAAARLGSGCLATASARLFPDQESPIDSSIYLIITVKEIGSIEEAATIREEVDLILGCLAQEHNSSINSSVKTAMTLVAYQDDKIDLPEQQAIIKQMFNEARAAQPSGLLSKDLISLTAYTPDLIEQEMVAGIPVNLQIASRYHRVDHRTYFQIGIPLLMTEY